MLEFLKAIFHSSQRVSNMSNTWSEKLLEETRNILNGNFIPRDEFVYYN